MGAISRNPQFYTVGVPSLFFMPVANWEDPHVVDWTALFRAYSGLTNPSGQVMNMAAITTCMTPEDILSKAYVGNLATCEVGGEIKTVEHVASVAGRKEVDKLVVTRRSIEYNVGFDELNVGNMRNFFAADAVDYPTKDKVIAKTTAKAPQTAAADFAIGEVEVIDNATAAIGTNLDALEAALTERLMGQGCSFAPVAVGGTDYYPAGVYYFIVADLQRNNEVDTPLNAYRGKIICAFFKYSPSEGRMVAQAWPTGMNSANHSYADTNISSRVKQLITDSTANIGIPSNDVVNDRSGIDAYSDSLDWVVNATSAVTKTKTVQLPAHVCRQATRVIVSGKKWDGTAWVDFFEVLFDYAQAAAATNLETPLSTGTAGYFIDNALSKVNHDTGLLTLVATDAFAGTDGDMDEQGLTEQTMRVQIETYSTSEATIVWSGIVWAKNSEVYGTMRVNRGKPELQGCGLIAFPNNVGVSFFHVLPKVVFRPDGTIDFSKEDWLKGGFVLSMLKDDSAYVPYLPNKIKIPFGYFNAFRMDAQV